MFDVRSRWRPWTGAGAAAIIAEYADAKGSAVSSTLTNGELVALAAVAADAFGFGGHRWNSYVEGGGSWGAGALIGSLARGRITSTNPAPAPKASGGAPAGGGSPAASPSGADVYIPAASYGVGADGSY